MPCEPAASLCCLIPTYFCLLALSALWSGDVTMCTVPTSAGNETSEDFEALLSHSHLSIAITVNPTPKPDPRKLPIQKTCHVCKDHQEFLERRSPHVGHAPSGRRATLPAAELAACARELTHKLPFPVSISLFRPPDETATVVLAQSTAAAPQVVGVVGVTNAEALVGMLERAEPRV